MTIPRLTIVAAPPPDQPFRYEGMDRPPLAPSDDVPEELVVRAAALEDVDPKDALKDFRAFMFDLVAAGIEGYELLWVGADGPAGWRRLGYDVGETTSAAWSAIARWKAFLSPEHFETWRSRLNDHGLFADRGDAESYLARYLESDDPDRGWTRDGWTDVPDIYSVLPVWRQ